MAYFTETDEAIILKHHNTIYTFKKTSEEEIQKGIGAKFEWSTENIEVNKNFKLSQRKLTITTPGNLARFVISAFNHGFSIEKYLFDQKDGKQISVNNLTASFCVQTYKNNILQEEYSKTDTIYTHKKFDINRGTYRVFEKEKLSDGTIMRKTYYTYNDLQSQTTYSIKTPSGRLLEEGSLDANNQKHGTIMTYDKNGRRKNSYYENGKKLSFGKRLFSFRRKITSSAVHLTSNYNELTR
ncbi:MAG: hypothetical protein IKV03_02820 [Alphaproteobacteria bacterium]|nr:hypothetical protein [Alphaproteobacteria bacterium]